MRLRRRLWNPYLLVFLSSACIMTIELVASRMIAPRLGRSIYTWTSVIAVILAGISLGNYLGGRLSDRHASFPVLGVIFSLGALATLSVLWLNNDMHDVTLPVRVPFVVWVLLYVAGVYLLPSIVLGCVSPMVVKLAVTDLKSSGTTVGRIYASSSVGSIVGTFATGFFLVGQIGTKTTLLLVAGILLALGLWFLTASPWRRALLAALVVLASFGGSSFALQRAGFLASECMMETDYFCVNVTESEREGRTIRQLTLDRLVHSYTDMHDPTHLVYGYEKTYAALIEPLMAHKPDLSAFFIGGGGYTFPRYLEVLLPESHVVVAEIDPGVTEAAHLWLNLDRNTRIETHNMDARQYMAWEAEPGSFDLVFGDAFNDFSVPFHLTTLEFDQLVDRLLREDGLYLANIIDGGPHGQFFRGFVRALQSVFRYVVVIPSADSWRSSYRTTFVIAASQQPLDVSYLPAVYRPLSDEELAEYLALKPSAILTDDYVPVDNLMAPVVSDSYAGSSDAPELLELLSPRALAGIAGGLAACVVLAIWLVRRSARRRNRGRLSLREMGDVCDTG